MTDREEWHDRMTCPNCDRVKHTPEQLRRCLAAINRGLRQDRKDRLEG